MITLFGRATSSNVQSVAWALNELGLAYERHDVGGVHGGTNTEEYRAMNPNGLVPTLQDGDLIMWESGAILRYLAARYGDEAFWPSDPVRRAPLDMWAEWAKTTFGQILIYQLFHGLVRCPPSKIDHAAMERSLGLLHAAVPRLEARLGDGPYIDGETFTFADIAVGHLLYRYYTIPMERIETPNLDAYYARLQERPAYREHVMVSWESLRGKD